MAVLIASAGYEGTVNETEWAGLLSRAGGHQYGVAGEGHWGVTAGTGDREVRIAPGTGFGWGVIDTSTEPELLQLDAVASGLRWDLVVARRDWAENRTTFAVVQGSATKAIPATRATSVGAIDEQPVALVRVQAGQSRVAEVVDLRVWNGSYAADPLVLQYLDRVGARIRIGRALWERAIDSLGSPTWRKQGDTGSKFTRAGAFGFPTDASTGGGPVVWDGSGPNSADFTNQTGRLRCNVAGRYLINAQVSLSGMANPAIGFAILRKNGANLAQSSGVVSPYGPVGVNVSTVEDFSVGDVLQLNVHASPRAITADTTGQRTYLNVTRIGYAD